MSMSNGPEPRYVGAYGRLSSFLKDCLRDEVVTEAQYLELRTAVEALSQAQGTAVVSSSQPLFRGSEKDFAQVLPAMGITTSPPCARGDSTPKDDRRIHTMDNLDVSSLWEDPMFNCRTRGDVTADARAIVMAFRSHYDLLSRYDIDPFVLVKWVEAIGNQYIAANPYHNWMHAVDVFQFTYLSLFAGGGEDYFNFQDILVLLCATLAHDVKHPGVSNAFLVSTGAPLAIMYNDRSPLENMHAACFFETMHQPGQNFLGNMASHDLRVFRGKVIDAILATDMNHHFELVDKLSTRLSKKGDSPFSRDTKCSREKQQSSKDDRRLLLQVFMHAADLGHSCRPWNIHRIIVADLEEEFFRQGDRERELGVPIMPMMDRSKDSAAAGQGFFLGKLVSPLLEPFSQFLAVSLGSFVLENLTSNCSRWEQLVKRHSKATAQELLVLQESMSQAMLPLQYDSDDGGMTGPAENTDDESPELGQDRP